MDVTQSNSVRVSFANRIENGGSFAKEPARVGLPASGLCRAGGPRAWAAHGVLSMRGSGPRHSLAGHVRRNSVFIFQRIIKDLFNLVSR